jgi:hypothetical protein
MDGKRHREVGAGPTLAILLKPARKESKEKEKNGTPPIGPVAVSTSMSIRPPVIRIIE